MILNSKETTVIYRCPHCGLSVVGMVGIFTLTGDMIKLKCDCEHSTMTITRTKDGKIKLCIPCLSCGGDHTFVISEGAFFEKKVLALTCAYTGIEICFIGGKDDCLSALEKSDEELRAIMDEAGLEDFDKFHNESGMTLTDPETENLVRFMLEELKEDGCIHCKCPDGQGNYDFRFMNEDVLLFCKDCNANTIVPMSGTADAMQFINADDITLK